MGVPAAEAVPSAYLGLAPSPAGIAQYTITADGRLIPKRPPRVGPAIGEIAGIAALPDGSSVYAAQQFDGLGPVVTGDHRLWQYDVSPATGGLTLKQPMSVTTGTGPSQVVVAPDGRSVYVTNIFTTDISQFTVTAGGQLAPKRPARVPSCKNPVGTVVTPNGRYVYSACFASNLLGVFSVNRRTGALTRKTAVPVDQPVDVGITPNGLSLYVTVLGGVAQFDINPNTGALRPKAVPVVPVSKPLGFAISPNGRSAYVGVDGIAQFNVNTASGELSPKRPAVVPVPGVKFPGINKVAVTADGRNVYATSDQPPDLFWFRADLSGRLQPARPPAVRVGPAQTGIAFLPDAPKARFSARVTGGTARFDATGSTDAGGQIVRYDWIFGDGSRRTTTGPSVSHRYRYYGRYRVTLSATSAAGCGPGRFIYGGRSTTCTGRYARITFVIRV